MSNKNKTVRSSIRSPWRSLLVAVLFILVLILSIMLLSAREHAAELQSRLQRAASNQTPAAPAPAPIAHQTCLDFFRTQSKEFAGTREALAMLDSGKFDVLRADCLIAKDIPECATLNIETVDAWFSKVADKIREGTRKYLETAEGKAAVARYGEAHVRVQSVANYLARVQKIDYVENEVYRADWPWHSFCFGIVKEGRGTCATMAYMWKILGDKLGLPITLRHTYKHVYAHWKDGGGDFNIEPTEYGRTFEDALYREREQVTVDEQASGVFMRDMTPRQILAAMLSARAGYWNIKNERAKGLADSLLALSLYPTNPRLRKNVITGFYNTQEELEGEVGRLVGEETLLAYKQSMFLPQSAQNAPLNPAEFDLRPHLAKNIPDINIHNSGAIPQSPFSMDQANPALNYMGRARGMLPRLPGLNVPGLDASSRGILGTTPNNFGRQGLNSQLLGPRVPDYRMGSFGPQTPNLEPLSPYFGDGLNQQR